MNLPFKFSLSNTNLYGSLWNPWGTALPAGSVTNDILANLNADLQERYGLKMPRGPVFVTGFTIMSDSADAKISIGVWDTDLAAFHELYAIGAVVVAGGGLVRPFVGSGLCLPVSATLLPMLRYNPVSGSAGITGDFDLHVISPSVGFGATTTREPAAQNILDDAGALLLTESGFPLKTE